MVHEMNVEPLTEDSLEETSSGLSNSDTVTPEASDEFVYTPQVQRLTERAAAYLEAGYPVHFAGLAGTGKTTLAFHVAAQLGRPVSLIHGNDEFGSSDLVGQSSGYRRQKLVDNYIHSVLKTEEEMRSMWIDDRLTTACLNGETLIYDEFNRSKPEANNVFLSILSEKILNLPKRRVAGDGYIEVHPDFRVIFTSNPEEYAGTHKSPDALMDRLITLSIGHYDRDTEIRITMAKSGLSIADAALIVDVVRELREMSLNKHRPTIRACIIAARVFSQRGGAIRAKDPFFKEVCRDVMKIDKAKVTHGGESMELSNEIDEAIEKVWANRKLVG
jgi:gas vesicle protein GvpN